MSDPQIKSYATNMELIKEFYLKFSLNLEILPEDLYIIFVSKITYRLINNIEKSNIS